MFSLSLSDTPEKEWSESAIGEGLPNNMEKETASATFTLKLSTKYVQVFS